MAHAVQKLTPENRPILIKSVFSFLRQLSMWHCSHLLLLLLGTPGCFYQSISPACTVLSSKPTSAVVKWWDRQMDGRTHGRFTDPAPHTMLTASVDIYCRYIYLAQWRNYNFWAPQQTFVTNSKVSRQGWWFCEIPVHSLITVLIHNSGHFGPPLPFWAPGSRGCRWLVMPLTLQHFCYNAKEY